ncbi:MAG: HAD family hydrolase [Rhodospirillum sp.]|nr:HAD family hydrolase [Rhodospirillum sp.]MCF8487573.1 HAD family hydrolase [Rhodospirillum sp.]MCF8499056.1 HAD family hydrolase [Rhodospirillum sp.]
MTGHRDRVTPDLARSQGLLLDLHGTVMVDGNRFQDRDALVAHLRREGGHRQIPEDKARRWFDDALEFMGILYEDPTHWGRFPSLASVFHRVAPELAGDPSLVAALVDTVAVFEQGTVPLAHAEAVRELARTHALAVVSNIWSPKARWLAELDRVGILSCFDVLVFSSDGSSVKPRSAPFLAATRGLGLPLDRLLVIGGDPLRDGYGARQAGLDVLIVGREGKGLDFLALATRVLA